VGFHETKALGENSFTEMFSDETFFFLSQEFYLPQEVLYSE